MCIRSGWKGLSPARVRRTTAMTMSVRGSRSTATGMIMGRNTPTALVVGRLAGSTWPVTIMVTAAEIRPSCMEPESPMKMVAGLKL